MTDTKSKRSGNTLLADPVLANVPHHHGFKVLGPVVLYRKLGEGGMSVVYEGRHSRLLMDVAVKVMVPPGNLPAEERSVFLKRFRREARTAAKIHHQNLVHVSDINQDHGLHFLIMEYVDGETSSERLKRKGALPEVEALTIVTEAATGLAAAHAADVVHRDVKPDNILISWEGTVKVADLGLAKLVGGDMTTAETQLTMPRVALGTPSYMSPEQTRAPGTISPASDVWSLGVTLFQLLTGELPWHDEDLVELISQIRRVPPRDILELRDDLSDGTLELLERALSKDPKIRHEHCGDMGFTMGQILGKLTDDPPSMVDSFTESQAMNSSPPDAPSQEQLKLISGELEDDDSAADPEADSEAEPEPEPESESDEEEEEEEEESAEDEPDDEDESDEEESAGDEPDDEDESDEEVPAEDTSGDDSDDSDDKKKKKKKKGKKNKKDKKDEPPEPLPLDTRVSNIHMILADDRPASSKWQVLALVVVMALGVLLAYFLFQATERKRARRGDAGLVSKPAASPAPDASTPDLAVDPKIKLGVRVRETLDIGDGVKLQIAWIQDGSFMMGTMTDHWKRPDERPKHMVTISRPYYISRHEVTNQQYRLFRPDHRSGSQGRYSLDGQRQPAVNVTWLDAVAYCQWLSVRLERKVRLPTEAEWEFAARGKAGGENHWAEAGGDVATYANVADGSARKALRLRRTHRGDDGHVVTAKVGSYKPNWSGLFDTIGNAAEWTGDWYAERFYRRTDGKDPGGPGEGKKRVLRGGSWRSGPADSRVASRAAAAASFKSAWLGFRVVVELTPGEREE